MEMLEVKVGELQHAGEYRLDSSFSLSPLDFSSNA